MPSQFVHLQQLFAFSKRAFQSAETPEKVADITYCLGNPQGSSIRNLNLFQKAKTKDNQLTMGLVRLFLCCFLWKIPSIDSWHQRHRDLEKQLRWQWCDHWVLICRYHTLTTFLQSSWTLTVNIDNCTQETQLFFPSTAMVYLHCPRMIKSLMVTECKDTWWFSSEKADA